MHELKAKITELLAARGGRTMRIGELLSALGLPATERKRLRRLLREISAEGGLTRLRGQQYAAASSRREVVGKLQTSTKGFGFVMTDADYVSGHDIPEVFIPRRRMGDALNGDRVRVHILGDTARSPEGEVIEVIERGTKQFVGSFYFTKRGGHVIPRDERMTRSIVTPRPKPSLQVDNGDFVVARIREWTAASEPLLGEVVEVLGDLETPGIDVTVIIRDSGVEPDFPPEVIRESEQFPASLADADLAGREDFRQMMTFTMDGATAKDFDDALSLESTDSGLWRLGVHIADVSHYVTEGSLLDIEARDRATSIYPIDRVVPMLPERLSNGLCSLRPDEDRLAMSCIMEIDDRGKVWDFAIRESVIRSRHRLTYEEVQSLVDGTAAPETVRAIGGIRPQLDELYQLRRVLTAMRLRRGALDLDVPETEVVLDSEGHPTAIERRSRLESHRVVEECMLIANEVVATHLFNLHVPSLYRVHEDPDLDKLRKLQPVLAHLGVKFPARKDITADSIQAALEMTNKSATGHIARRLILRAMMRAHYHDENLGHFGLGSACYTHFTSPIRRYPDLVVHRLLKEARAGGAAMEGIYMPPGSPPPEHGDPRRGRVSLLAPPPLPHDRVEMLRATLGEWGRHCSERERRAESIEQDSTTIKSLEYMRQFLGQEFDGNVTSVLSWGFFVELETIPVEGLVHVRSLDDDYYEYDEEHMVLIGKQTGKSIRIADRVRVGVEHVNVSAMTLDFLLVRKHHTGKESEEQRAVRQAVNTQRQQRHTARRPTSGGFQKRGRKRK